MSLRRHMLLPIACTAAFATGHAAADPGYYVVTPYPEEGVRTIDIRYWTVDLESRPEVIWPELGLAYGVNSRWTTELFVSWIGPSMNSLRASSLNWQNDILLTQGERPFDLALHVQAVADLEGGPAAIEVGPVWQTDIGRTQLNANLFVERQFGASRRQSQLKYQWQVRHRWQRGLHLGAQGFGEVGPWDDWLPRERQSHRAGPAVFSTFHPAEGQTLSVQGAWLLGNIYGKPGHMLTVQAKLGF